MKQTVTVFGPNLRDKSGGYTFHVHDADCADAGKYRFEERFTIHAMSLNDIVAEVYDFLEEDELLSAMDEFLFKPCVKLKEETA